MVKVKLLGVSLVFIEQIEYYMVTWGYKIALLVLKNISHSKSREILYLRRAM